MEDSKSNASSMKNNFLKKGEIQLIKVILSDNSERTFPLFNSPYLIDTVRKIEKETGLRVTKVEGEVDAQN